MQSAKIAMYRSFPRWIFGKDLVAIAEIKHHRRMKNIEISKEMNAAIKSINELWDDPQRRKVNESLGRLLLPRAGLKENKAAKIRVKLIIPLLS